MSQSGWRLCGNSSQPRQFRAGRPLNKPFVDPEPVFIGSLCYYRTALIKMFHLATNAFVESHL